MSEDSRVMPWLIIELNNQDFALPGTAVRELVIMPEVAGLPDVPDYVRGTVNLRGRVMAMVDLRKRLGMRSALEETDEFCELMRQRERDHGNWLRELEASAAENREFTLTTDPHQCAFGKWYDSYQAGNPWIAALLRQFDKPHRQIHAVATEVDELLKAGANDMALAAVERARHGVLNKMVELFSRLRSMVREEQKELVVVFAVDGRTFAAAVDGAIAVERLNADTIHEIPSGAHALAGHAVHRVCFRPNRDKPTLIIEPGELIDFRVIATMAA